MMFYSCFVYHSAICLCYRDDVHFSKVKAVLATSAGHMDMLTGEFDFQYGVFYWCSAVTICLKRTAFALATDIMIVDNDRAPVYLADSVTATANISRRIRLRSASSFRYEQPRTRLKLGERCYRLRRPGCLEQSAIILSRTVQYRHFQAAP